MSEQIRNKSKRRRTEGETQLVIQGVNEGASTSAAAVASTSTAAELSSSAPIFGAGEPLGSTFKKVIMEPVALRILLQVKARKILIVDCRDPNFFQEWKINSADCVNAPVREPENSSDVIIFPTKTSVISFLQKYCPSFLVHLRPPGHYANIVVLDDFSTAEECSKPVKLMFDAFVKWNEKEKTNIHILQGGIERFSEDFPNLIATSNEADSPDLQPDHTVTQADIVPAGSLDTGKEEVEGFLCYLKDLDEVIGILRKLINLEGELAPLETLKPTLKRELADDEDKLSKKLDKFIPEDVKCSICFEVFQGEISQCRNGHSICSNCCRTLTTCPECRVPYADKIRNRALENLLRNSLKVECVCGEMLEVKEVQSHVANCVKKRKGIEMVKLENDLGVTKEEIDRLNAKLAQMNKIILDTEMLWCSRLGREQQEKVTPDVWRKFYGYRSAKKSTIQSLERTLFSLVFCKPDFRF